MKLQGLHKKETAKFAKRIYNYLNSLSKSMYYKTIILKEFKEDLKNYEDFAF